MSLESYAEQSLSHSALPSNSPDSDLTSPPQIDIARVSVVILNYRTPEMVVDCLESLSTEVDITSDRVIVVDNQSPDDSVAVITDAVRRRGWGRWCRVVVSPSNDGFSAGNNFGIESQKSQYYWLLNSDTLVRPGALQYLLAAGQRHPDAAIVAPRLTWLDGEPQESRFRFSAPDQRVSRIGAIEDPFTSHRRKTNRRSRT